MLWCSSCCKMCEQPRTSRLVTWEQHETTGKYNTWAHACHHFALFSSDQQQKKLLNFQPFCNLLLWKVIVFTSITARKSALVTISFVHLMVWYVVKCLNIFLMWCLKVSANMVHRTMISLSIHTTANINIGSILHLHNNGSCVPYII